MHITTRSGLKYIIIISALSAVVVLLAIILVAIIVSTKPIPPTTVSTADQRDQSGLTPYQKNEVNNTIAKKTATLRKLYVAFVATKPKITDGSVTIDWQIGLDGKVVKAEVVRSDLNAPAFEQALANEAANWEFPPPPDKQITYAFYKFNFKKTD